MINFLVTILFSLTSYSLNIDEKLISRIIGLSDTKKTILVNKGSEHGLKKGDHAKFSLPTGMISRGVCVKLSPTRSVWSIYRFFAIDKIQDQLAFTLKIAKPVRLTQDETKNIGKHVKKYMKKKESIPGSLEGHNEIIEKKMIKRSMTKAINQPAGKFQDVDFSGLDDMSSETSRLKEEVDWSGLNGKKDKSYFDASLDYSSLR